MLSEVAVTSSSADSLVYIWDLRSGAILGSLKGNKSDARTTATLPIPAHSGGTLFSSGFLAAQNDRALVHVWNWTKGQLHAKFVLPEKLSSLAISHSGLYCVGGGQSGRVYIWQLNTGRLLRMFDGHYKAVRIIKFTTDDDAFLTGGEDSVVNVWILSSVLDPSNEAISSPHRSLSGHALPISDLVCGIGLFTNTRIFTASMDRTCKIWEPAKGELLATIVYPKAITSLTLDATETHLYAGATDGTIYQTKLYHDTAEGDTAAFTQGAVQDGESKGGLLLGHNQSVTSLALTFDESLLLSASSDGTAVVWDISSRQSLRVFANHKAPISDAQILLRPPHLMDASASSAYFPILKPWKRHPTTDDDLDEWEEEVDLPVMQGLQSEFAAYPDEPATIDFLEERVREVESSNDISAETEIMQLREQLDRLKEQNESLIKMNDDLYQAAISRFMRATKSSG